MKIIGLICEYNPFHNGHLYHLNEAKKQTNADVCIVICTTYFSMRGEVSILNKYEKAKVAIDNGADLVIELPFLLGCQSANLFAYNAIKLLNELGINEIIAGSETNDIKLIKSIYELNEKVEFQNAIKNKMKEGFSYRKSFSDSLIENQTPCIDSNDMLNLMYYEAIQKINPNIKLTLIKRIKNNYLDNNFTEGEIQSAKAIRNNALNSKYVPEYIYKILKNKKYPTLNDFTQIFKHLIINYQLNNIYEAKEGLNKAVKTDFLSINELIDKLTTKRYTTSRISRFICYIITNTTKDDIKSIKNYTPRIIGINDKGQRYLNSIKKSTNYYTNIKNGLDIIYDFEIKIARIFSNLYHTDYIKIEQTLPYIKKTA